MNRLLPAMPARIARLPRDHRGFPIPFFVQTEPEVDFRVVRPGTLTACVKRNRCWICGDALGRTYGFVAGPMCALNRTSSEPPSHRECAEFAVQACPFMVQPRMRRNAKDLPDHAPVPGFHLDRNPGVALIWIARHYETFRPHAGGEGLLFEMGEPIELLWFAQGRPATRQEVAESIETGLPTLLASADSEPTEARRRSAHAELGRRLHWLTLRLPPHASDAANDAAGERAA